jgi:hypothetical protein
MTIETAGCDPSFRRFVAICAIVSAPLAIGSVVTSLATVRFDFSAMADPMMLLRAGVRGAALWRTSMLLDLFGFYLPIVPLVLFLRAAFRPRAEAWSELFGFALLSYCVVGAIGATMIAMAVPPIIKDYAEAWPADRAILSGMFSAQSNDVYRGLWNLLEMLIGGIGWIGFGWLLRPKAPAIAGLTLALGVACLADSIGTILGQELLSLAGLIPYLVLAPLWALVLGLRLLGKDFLEA